MGAGSARSTGDRATPWAGGVTPPDVAISFLKAREIGMQIPFSFFEIANFVYDYQGQAVRAVKNELPTN